MLKSIPAASGEIILSSAVDYNDSVRSLLTEGQWATHAAVPMCGMSHDVSVQLVCHWKWQAKCFASQELRTTCQVFSKVRDRKGSGMFASGSAPLTISASE